MTLRGPFGLSLALASILPLTALLVACGSGDSSGPRGGASEGGSVEISGIYAVEGATVDLKSGQQRPISGTVTLEQTGERYTSHFEFKTVFPGTKEVAAEVVGTGEGTVEGGVLTGSAEVQLVASTVPGVDVGFAMIPRDVGPRIASTSVATIADDGSVKIEIRNTPAEGEADYRPTRTTLVGKRKDQG